MIARNFIIAGVLSTAACSATLADTSTGLIAGYSLDGSAGETTGAGPNGTLQNGAVMTTDRCGRSDSAVYLPANVPPTPYSGAYVNVGTNAALNAMDQAFSVAFWIKTATDGIIIDKDIIGTVNNDWWISLTGGGKPTFGLGSSSILVFNANVANDSWHHLVFVRNRTTGHARVYVDGIALPDQVGATNSVANSAPIHIGAWDTPSGFREGFVGSIDEVRFYSRELSAGDVAELMNIGTCCTPPTTFGDGFEGDSVASAPAGWPSRFAGVSQAVVASPTFSGNRAMKLVAGAANACEIHSSQTWKSTADSATLEFCLRWSSESTNPGGGCNDITVDYQGDHGSLQCGFVGSGASGLVIQGTNIAVQPDRWYRFRGVADYNKGTATWYVDDVRVIACQTLIPGALGADRSNRIELHVGCIDSGQSVAYFDSIGFTPGTACRADDDLSGTLTVGDVFSFLNRWFSGCP
ncbi:MAG TPA: LamG domain-containing protein [Phycisphaerales bacterium]|nr:LamG domain-containing protein [Phycisphaerales bacterium]